MTTALPSYTTPRDVTSLVVSWYQAVALGGDVRQTYGFFGEKIDRSISEKPDNFWKVSGSRSAALIMGELAEIAGREGLSAEGFPLVAQNYIVRVLKQVGVPLSLGQIQSLLREAGHNFPTYSVRGWVDELVARKEIHTSGQGLYAANESLFDVNYPKSDTPQTAPAVPPVQGHGPHLGVENGVIVFAPVSNSADTATDLRKVERLLPLVRDALEEFLLATPVVSDRDNDPFHRDRRMAARYLDASSGAVGSMDFDLLFGVGTSLMNRLAADAKRSMDSDLPPLSDAQRLALDDFQANHGPLIVATKAGAEAVADAEKVIRNPEQERKLREILVEFMASVKAEDGLAKPQVAELLYDAAAEMGTGHQAERSFRFGQGAARNTAIVLTSVGTIAALPAAGLAVAGFFGTIFGVVLSYVLWEATKKSKPFAKAIEPITRTIDGLSELDSQKIEHLIESGTSDRFARFTLKEEARLRAIAGDRPEYAWLHQQLDFLKANYKPKK